MTTLRGTTTVGTTASMEIDSGVGVIIDGIDLGEIDGDGIITLLYGTHITLHFIGITDFMEILVGDGIIDGIILVSTDFTPTTTLEIIDFTETELELMVYTEETV